MQQAKARALGGLGRPKQPLVCRTPRRMDDGALCDLGRLGLNGSRRFESLRRRRFLLLERFGDLAQFV